MIRRRDHEGDSMRWVRWTVTALGWAAVLAAAVGVLAHYLDSTATVLVVLASFAPFLMACGVVGLAALPVRATGSGPRSRQWWWRPRRGRSCRCTWATVPPTVIRS